MGTLYQNIIALCDKKGIKGGKMCTDLGISKGLLTDLKMGRRSGVSAVTAQKIASYFGVSVGFLLNEEQIADEKPAEERVEAQGGEKPKAEYGELKLTNSVLPLSQHEMDLIRSYRLHPEFQVAVDRLLGIESDGYVQVYSAASSKDNRPDQIIAIKKEEWEKIKSAKDTDDPLL